MGRCGDCTSLGQGKCGEKERRRGKVENQAQVDVSPLALRCSVFGARWSIPLYSFLGGATSCCRRTSHRTYAIQ